MHDEPSEKPASHVDRHAKRGQTEIDPYKLRVTFSNHMQGHLQNVVAEVRRVGRSEEDNRTRHLIPDLQELLSGDIRLVKAMHHMADLGKQLQWHTRLTGDAEAESKWKFLVLGMHREHPDMPKPFTLTHDKSKDINPSVG